MQSRALEITVTDRSRVSVEVIEDRTAVPALLAAAVTGGLVLTELFFGLCCSFPAPGALSWVGLGTYTAVYIIAAPAIYAVVLGAFCRLFADQLELPFREIV